MDAFAYPHHGHTIPRREGPCTPSGVPLNLPDRLRFEGLGPLKGSLKIGCVDTAELRELLPYPLNAVALKESGEESAYCYFE